MSRNDAAVSLLQALVRIPSVNPEGDPGTEGIGEAKIAEFLVDHLRSLGAEPELQTVLPDRPNVLARFPSDRPGKPKLLLAPHTDTVSVLGMIIDPFAAEERNGKIYGRGTSDTKGTMAAMLTALAELGADRIARLNHEVWFAGLMGEEAGLTGSQAMAATFRPDFVLVGEPTKLGIVYTHKGSSWLTIRTKGTAVHASMPEMGRNAILEMTRVINVLESYRIDVLPKTVDPVLGSPTMNIGTIRGGSKVNIVPDFCEIQVDLRTIPSQNIQELERELTAQLASLNPEIELRFDHRSALRTDLAHPLIDKLVAAGGSPTGAPWFCDAASFAAKGVPSVAAGPGSIEQAHTRDEWISVADLSEGVLFYKTFLASLDTSA